MYLRRNDKDGFLINMDNMFKLELKEEGIYAVALTGSRFKIIGFSVFEGEKEREDVFYKLTEVIAKSKENIIDIDYLHDYYEQLRSDGYVY